MEERAPLKKDLVRPFMLAGKATLTVKNHKTGKHKTFRITQSEDKRVYFVSIRGDQDSGKDAKEDKRRKWLYMGMIQGTKFFRTKNSKVATNSQSFVSFKWLNDTAIQWELGTDKYPKVEVFHEGRCGKCGRSLTDPVSIDKGFGPSCYKMLFG